ncbi:MAG: hypothetical protein FWB85_07220 [Chitinispirillia bacterium]|nr:hypothetical protein [Chitinispirillia bacterium]MCL2242038.1 hypothetical protein [Chitinispirillia bacterium]
MSERIILVIRRLAAASLLVCMVAGAALADIFDEFYTGHPAPAAKADTAGAAVAAVADTSVADAGAAEAVADADDAAEADTPAIDIGGAAAAAAVLPPVKRLHGDFMFSVRPEFVIIAGEILTAGVDFEFGMLPPERGLYHTWNAGVGANYFGGAMNIGYFLLLDEYRQEKAAFGGTAGFNYALWQVRVQSEAKNLLSRDLGGSIGFAGAFGKMIFGLGEEGRHNIDITAKALFGYKYNSVSFDDEAGVLQKKDNGFGIAVFAGVGYTLINKEKRGPAAGAEAGTGVRDAK